MARNRPRVVKKEYLNPGASSGPYRVIYEGGSIGFGSDGDNEPPPMREAVEQIKEESSPMDGQLAKLVTGKESGAAMSNEELAEIADLFPKHGDPEDILLEKKKMLMEMGL